MRLDWSALLPRHVDAAFEGPRWVLWVFGALTAVTLWRSQHHIFASDGGAQSIATIPLDSMTETGRAAVIGVFALWGLSQLLLALVQLAALIRWRGLIAPLLLVMAAEYAGRMALGGFKPIPLDGAAPGGAINLPMVAICLTLALAACYRRDGASV